MATNRPRNRNEMSELENSFQNLAQKNAVKKTAKHVKSAKKKNTLIIACCAVGLAIAMLVGGHFLYQYLYDNAPIHANLTIAGVDVSGMTRAEAELAVAETSNNAYVHNTIAVSIDDNIIRIPYSVSGVTLDVEAAVNAAIHYEQAGSEKQSLDITSFLTVDKDAVMAQLAPLSKLYTSTLTQSTYEIVGDAPVDVIKLDENAILQTLRITIGTPGIALDLEDLYQKVLDAYNDCVFGVNYKVDVAAPDPVDLNAIYNQYSAQPVEATMDKETFEVTGGNFGYDFDVEAAQNKLNRANYGDVVEIPFRWIEPENTAEELASVLFRDTLASYTTEAGSIYNRNINLKLACQAINGVVLYPGDEFSYNDTLGERTTEKGYKPGISYIGGESVMDIGGGICQVSSTLYYCTLIADLEIVERWNHAYASSYIPLSADATVFWGGVDFKFKNNTEYPIRIEAFSNYGDVTVKLIGTDTKDYYVKYTYKKLETIPYETEYKEFPPDNEDKYEDGDLVSSPYTGYISQGFKVYYDKETNNKLRTELLYTDTYHSRNKVLAKIVDPNAPTDPPPTDPVTPPVEGSTDAPTDTPTDAPTQAPTEAPTQAPTEAPTQAPTEAPTEAPTNPPAE